MIQPSAIVCGRRLVAAGVVIAATLGAPSAAEAFHCRVAVALARNVSGGVGSTERGAQSAGGGVMAAAYLWSGPSEQALIAYWGRLDGVAAIERFAAKTERIGSEGGGTSTAVGDALGYGGLMHTFNREPCDRRVLDISGNGVGDAGPAPAQVRDASMLRDIEINALAMRTTKPDPLDYFQRRVIQEPGAFAIGVTRDQDYADARERKLLRERSFTMAMEAP